ncbi:hypothetical protein [Tenacibaculum sp. 190524A05c]|uniref:hypothetical protein n=1 Tax=Tenacibaculum platacis TaxID=3137852 RepID=UPI0032B1602A
MLKSKDRFTSISIDNDRTKKLITPFCFVNGVIIKSKSISVQYNSSHVIHILQLGYVSLKTKKIKVEKGDSLIINFYMKEFDRPLH